MTRTAPIPAEAERRRLVEESLQRSSALIARREDAEPAIIASGDELAALQRAHPLAAVQGLLDELVVEPARDAGVIVAVADAAGRLVWVDGDHGARDRAEGMGFVAGSDWSEARMGTSAPGAAVASGRAVQVVGEEHFAPSAGRFSCSALPVFHPLTEELLGAVDVTGDERAVAPHVLPLLRAAVAAVQRELRLRARQADDAGDADRRIRLLTLGAEPQLLGPDGSSLPLSTRHAEILALLAWHRDGLSALELGALLHPEGLPAVTVRAEINRLRAALRRFDSGLALLAQPYRLDDRITTDAGDVLRAVGRGAHVQALRDYRGALLPESTAPGVAEIRALVRATLREAVLANGSPDTVLDWLAVPGHEHDDEALRLALRLLPARSPKRAALIGRADAACNPDATPSHLRSR